MSIVTLHTVPIDAAILDNESSLCVFDSDDNLLADYSFCTGLRILGGADEWTVYINDVDLVPGRWVLNLTTMEDDFVRDRVEGFKEGAPEKRTLSGNPWDGCGEPVARVSSYEREGRLSACMTCDLLDRNSMTCTVSGKLVLDQTTRKLEYCPEEFWGNKKEVLTEVGAQAIRDGIVSTTVISPEDQKQFEADLELFFGSE